jgi:hypothetical protein
MLKTNQIVTPERIFKICLKAYMLKTYQKHPKGFYQKHPKEVLKYV